MDQDLVVKLLQQLADGVKAIPHHYPLGCVEVKFYTPAGNLDAEIGEAIDYLVNDVYLFHDVDLRLTTHLTVQGI